MTAIGKEIRGEAYSSTVYPDHLKPVDLTEIKEYRKHFSMSKQELSQESIATLLKQIDIGLQKTLAQRDEYIKTESEKRNKKAQEDGRVKAKELLQKETAERSARSASEAELLKRLQ